MGSVYSQITITWKVVSADGALPGTHLWKKSNYTINNVTDSDGFFSISGLQLGDTIICSFIGFKEFSFEVAASTDRITIKMESFSKQL